MKLLLKTLVVLAVISLAAWFYWQHQGVTLRFTETEIETRMQEHLPYEKRALALIKLTFDEPDIAFVAANNAISVTMQLDVRVASIIKSSGIVSVSGVPSYRADEAAFYLKDLSVDQLQIKGLPDKYSKQVRSTLSSSLKLFYQQRPIYKFRDDSTKQRLARLVLQDVNISDSQLVVKFGSKQ